MSPAIDISARLPLGLPLLGAVHLPQQLARAAVAHVIMSRSWACREADDDTLRTMADRIQARTIRRCGELLRAIKQAPAGRPKLGVAPPPISRSQAVRDAGLSVDQRKTAIRVARIPKPEFEQAVESERPPR